MKALICERCGGAINRSTMTCEFCGTQYALEESRVVFVRENPRIKTLCVEAKIDNRQIEYMESSGQREDFLRFCIEDLAHQLAESSVPFMSIDREFIPITNSTDLRARVRVVKPETKMF